MSGKPEPIAPPEIRSKAQLEILLGEYMSDEPAREASFQVVEGKETKDNQYIVDPGTRSRNHELLIDGMNIVRHRMQYNEMLDNGFDINEMHFWVDDLIRDRLGGFRKDDKVCWQVDDQLAQFDPFTGELTWTSA